MRCVQPENLSFISFALQRPLFQPCYCSHRRQSLVRQKVGRHYPPRFLCSQVPPPSNSLPITRPLTVPLQDDTQLTFMFSYSDMLQLVERLNQLVMSFSAVSEAAAQRKKVVQPVFEYYCERDGLFIHMECNPNLFTSAFQAKVYLRVYDDKLRVHSQASLTTLVDVVRKWKTESIASIASDR